MYERMVDKPIHAIYAISGKLEEVEYNLFMIRDKDFTIKLMPVSRKLDVQSDA